MPPPNHRQTPDTKAQGKDAMPIVSWTPDDLSAWQVNTLNVLAPKTTGKTPKRTNTWSAPALPLGLAPPASNDTAIYARMSNEEAAVEGWGLEDQLDRLRDYARFMRLNIVKEYVDPGFSGKTTKRPAYEQMMAESHLWNKVIFLNINRIHRNVRNFLTMMSELHVQGKTVCSLLENIDTSTAIGRAVMTIIAAMAEMESDQMGERISRAHRKKFNETNAWCGPTPVFMERGDGDVLKPSKNSHVLVHGAALLLDGVPLKAIAKAWNDAGHRTRQGRQFTEDKVRAQFSDPRICGYRVWHGYPVTKHGAVFDLDTYWAIQAELDRRSETHVPGRSTTSVRHMRNQALKEWLAAEALRESSGAPEVEA